MSIIEEEEEDKKKNKESKEDSADDNEDLLLNKPLDSLIEKDREIKKEKEQYGSTLEIDDESITEEYEEFDGLANIDLEILLPKSYFDGIDELSERIGLTITQWINYAVIKEINALHNLNNHYLYSPVNSNFLSRYKIGQLDEKAATHIVKRYGYFNMKYVVLND